MNRKARTALLITGIHVVFTVVKFAAYCFTGSMTVLAEAWHSLTDIATSMLVFVSMRGTIPFFDRLSVSDEADDTEASHPFPEKQNGKGEKAVAIGIGLFLLMVSLDMLYKSFRLPQTTISFPVINGCLFLFFSLCSYWVYRYEHMIGQSEESVGLTADAMHARSDVFASGITGVILILYKLGINLDRLGAVIIGLLIFATAVGTLRKGFTHIAPGDSHSLWHSIYRYCEGMLQPWWIRYIQPIHARISRHILKGMIILWLLAVCTLAAHMFVFTVDIGEAAILERVGSPHPTGTIYPPGIHCKYPWPIDRVQTINTRGIRSAIIGVTQLDPKSPLIWTRRHGQEEPFLSADNSLFYPYIVIEYTISNAYHFVYHHAQPQELLHDIASEVVSSVFIEKSFYTIATSYRGDLEQHVQSHLQHKLDQLQCGIAISSVGLKDIHPPITIAPAFENVIAAYQEKEQLINEAQAYRKRAVPEARGDAARIIAEGHSYRTRRIEHTLGDTERSLKRQSVYAQWTSVIKTHLYLSTIRSAMTYSRKFLVDPASGQPDMWVNFNAYADIVEEDYIEDDQTSTLPVDDSDVTMFLMGENYD